MKASFHVDTGLLPTFKKTSGADGTDGWFNIGKHGLAFGASLGAQAIDIFVLQMMQDTDDPNNRDLTTLKDEIETIAIDMRLYCSTEYRNSECMKGEHASATLEFGINIVGSLTLPDGDKAVCFKDTVANVEDFMRSLDSPSEQGPTITSVKEEMPSPSQFDAPHGVVESTDYDFCQGAADCNEAPEANDNWSDPAPTYYSTQVEMAEPGEFYDGIKLYPANKVNVTLTKPATSKIYEYMSVRFTGHEPGFEAIGEVTFTNIVTPAAAYSSAVEPEPAFCTTHLTTADLASSMALTADPARRLDAVDALSVTLARQTLENLHGAHKLFHAYHQEKERLVRRAIEGYAVVAVLALLFATSCGHFLRMQKWNAVATDDEERLVEEGIATE